jgi:hypothetical protein
MARPNRCCRPEFSRNIFIWVLLQDEPHQRSNLRRFKTQFAVICHWGNFKDSLQTNHEMRSAMPRAGRWPTTLQVQKIQNIHKFQDSWRVLLVEGLLEVRKVTFSRDSSRKWQSL